MLIPRLIFTAILAGFLVGFLAALLAPSLARAADEPSSAIRALREHSSAGNEREGLGFGYAYGFFNYSESQMRDFGSLNGIKFIYATHVTERATVRVESDYMLGRLQYDGHLFDPATRETEPHSGETYDSVFNFRALTGLTIHAAGQEITPLTGIGFRYLNDRLAGIGGYEREISYVYLPLGLEHVKRIRATGWRVASSVEYDVFLNGTVKSHMTDVGWDNDYQTYQSSGKGYRMAVDFSTAVNPTYDLHLGPYWQHWDVQDSSKQTQNPKYGELWEPDNKSDLIGLNIVLGI